MTQQPPPAPRTTINVRGVVSVLETAGFVVAAVFAAIHDGNYALISAMSAAVMHSVNHQ
jgi:uncharacterized membrane protein